MLMAFAIAMMFVVVAFLAMSLPAAWMRRKHGFDHPEDTRDLARDVSGRIGVLHALILGLVFGQVMDEARELRHDMRAEAGTVQHIAFRAREYGAPGVERAAHAYLDAVIRYDWPRQRSESKVSDEGWRAWNALSAQTLALHPTTYRERMLTYSMLQGVWRIEAYRQARAVEDRIDVPLEFWFASIAGLVLMGVVIFIHAPSRKHMVIGATYSIYAGIVLYMIWDLSHPFGGLVVLDSNAFEQALATLRPGT